MTKHSPFRYFKISPEIIRLAVMLHIRFPLSLRNVEDLLHERGIEISHETVRYWWNRFGPMFAAQRQWNWFDPVPASQHPDRGNVLTASNVPAPFYRCTKDREGDDAGRRRLTSAI